MSYTPTTWTTGDTITASAMNKIENGIANAGSAMIVDTNGSEVGAGGFSPDEVINATFADIYDALANGTPVYIRRTIETDGYSSDYTCCSALYSVICAFKYNIDYRVYAMSNSHWPTAPNFFTGRPTLVTFSAASPSAYPIAMAEVYPSNCSDGFD